MCEKLPAYWRKLLVTRGEIHSSLTSSAGSTSRASASLRMVRGCGSSTRPDSSLSIVVGLRPALSASSRCDSKRMSLTFRSLSPLMRAITCRIVQTFLSFALLSFIKCGVNYRKCCETVANVVRYGCKQGNGLAGDGAPRGLAHRRKGLHCERDKDIARRRRFLRSSQRS